MPLTFLDYTRHWLFTAVFLLGSYSSATYADKQKTVEKPQWELGMGIGYLNLAHYRGSDQRSDYVAPIPFVRYNGKNLKVDREGGRYYFYSNDDIKIDLSTALAFPVDSKDNQARLGMTDLDTIIELGPRIQFSLYESTNKNLRVRFALPLRAAIATDIKHNEYAGWVFSPYIQLRYYSGWETAISVGPIWASEEYHDYYYQVSPEFATASRPQYDAQAGYSGARITLTSSMDYKQLRFGLFAKYDNLSNAVFIDSPLVKQKDSFIFGFHVSWVFKESK